MRALGLQFYTTDPSKISRPLSECDQLIYFKEREKDRKVTSWNQPTQNQLRRNLRRNFKPVLKPGFLDLAFRNFGFRFFFVRDFVLEQIRDEVVPKCDLVRQVVGFHVRLKSCKHMFGFFNKNTIDNFRRIPQALK